MNTRKTNASKDGGNELDQPSISSTIQTPFDDMIPKVDEPSAQFYLDAMRIYLGLSSGTLSYEDALDAAEKLKNNPEYNRSPSVLLCTRFLLICRIIRESLLLESLMHWKTHPVQSIAQSIDWLKGIMYAFGRSWMNLYGV